MHYFGGKSRTAEDISKYLKSKRKENQIYIEPFVGAGWVIEKMDGERYAYDKHPYLIAMFKALQNGWTPPTSITEEEYRNAKLGNCEDYLRGFIGFGCSFSGKWFGGYARNGEGQGHRNYCLNAHNSIMKKMKSLNSVKFECGDYKDINIKGALIYCDPPYKGTTQYGSIVGKFDSDEFWNIVRKWSKDNFVVVSEYNCPDDFVCVWQKETKTDIRNKDEIREKRIEKLFIHNSLS